MVPISALAHGLMGHCQILPPLCPLEVGTVVFGSQQVHPFRSIGTVTTGQELVVDGFPASPHSIKNPHLRQQGPSTYEVILSDHPEQSTVLTRCGLPRSPHGLTPMESHPRNFFEIGLFGLISCQFQRTRCTKIRSMLILLPQIGV